MKSYRPFAIIILIALIVCVVLYWWALHQGNVRLAAEREIFNKQLQNVNSRLVFSECSLRLMQARLLLCRAISDLDQNNFGLANTKLQEAAAALGALNASIIGIDPTKLEAFRKEMAATHLIVTPNIDEQRSIVVTLSGRLDDLAPKTAAPVSQAQPTPTEGIVPSTENTAKPAQ